MFDFAWSELGLIAAVALILIGPKDLPVAIRTITDMIKKARRMASEFQTHVDEMMREADMHEVRDQIASIRNFDFRGEIERHIDPDRSLRDTFASNPLEPAPPSGAIAASAPMGETPSGETSADETAEGKTATGQTAVAELEPIPLAAPDAAEPPRPAAPAFVPPSFVLTPDTAGDAVDAPAFIPPQVVLQRGSRPSA
jgi:sec-independent protein translocase protein TatB